MSTQFFLRDTASDLGGAGQKALSTSRGAASTTAVTNTTASGTNIQVTKTAAGQVLTWFSPMLNGVIISGSITVNIRGLESSTSANAKAGITIEHTDRTGSVLSTIVANTAVPTTSSEYTTGDTAKNASFTPTSTTLADTDRIKVTLFVKNQGTMGGGFTVTNSYDGPTAAAAGDTYVTLTETVTSFTAWTLAGTASNAPATGGTFTAAGSIVSADTVTLALSPAAIGNLILAEVVSESATIYCDSISGGNCTWTQVGSQLNGSLAASYIVTLFQGVATGTGAANATLHFTGATPTIRCGAQEFNSSAGAWSYDGAQGNIDTTGTTADVYPTLTPAAAGDLYFGYAWASTTLSNGSTSGYVYQQDIHGNGLCYSLSCTSAAQTPAWGSNANFLGIAVLVAATGGSGLQSASGSITSGPLTTTWALAGTAAAVSTASGAVTLTPAVIAGTGSAASAASGAFLAAPAAGTAAAASSASGTITQLIPAAATAAGTSAASGAFQPAAAAGTAASASSAAADITVSSGAVTWPLAGTAAGISAGSGTLTLLASQAGTAGSASSASGTITQALPGAGTAASAGAASGAFLPASAAGTAATAPAAAGAFLAAPAAGNASTASTASGAITSAAGPVTWTAAGTAAAASTAVGTLILAPAVIAGTAVTSSGGDGVLAVIWPLAGTAVTYVTASGAPFGPLALAGTAVLTSAAAAVITAAVSYNATSAPAVTARNTSAPAVTGTTRSAAAVTDPRDASAAVTARTTGSPAVSQAATSAPAVSDG